MTTHDPIPARLAALKTATTPELKQQWRDLFQTEPPGLGRVWLERKIGYRLQEIAHGGLKPATVKRLEEIGEALISGKGVGKGARAETRLLAGTRLVRDWRGVEQVVTVTAEGYEWEGRPYRSLSAIARAITGTRWNGLVFFGLKRQRAGS